MRHARGLIDDAVDSGHEIDEIESGIIAPSGLSEDSRAALSLYALGCLDRLRDGLRPPREAVREDDPATLR